VRVKLSTNLTVVSVNTVGVDTTNMPSSLDDPVSWSSTWRSLMTLDF
jgi:hypothetical protein